jgi:hypothetical protein
MARLRSVIFMGSVTQLSYFGHLSDRQLTDVADFVTFCYIVTVFRRWEVICNITNISGMFVINPGA